MSNGLMTVDLQAQLTQSIPHFQAEQSTHTYKIQSAWPFLLFVYKSEGITSMQVSRVNSFNALISQIL